MTKNRESNYDITCRKMRSEFLKYDQEKMIRKFDLAHDESFLFLCFCGSSYRVNRKNGRIEHTEKPHDLNGESFHVCMSIYDVLCSSRDACTLSGKYTTGNELDNVVYSSGLGDSFYDEKGKCFEHRTDDLKRACVELGGVPFEKGDVGYRLQTFSFLPVILIFYDADEEFPSSLQLLWDERTLDFVHYETTYYIADVLLDHLLLKMDAGAQSKELGDMPGKAGK